jgi:hypothetical protein
MRVLWSALLDSAKGLKDVETVGKMDPYCKVTVGGQTFKTKVGWGAGAPLGNLCVGLRTFHQAPRLKSSRDTLLVSCVLL